jgi:hypothetical protein
MADEAPPPSLQESILAALVFDGKWGAAISTQVTPELFDGPYQEIAGRVLDYRRKYSKPPGRVHLDDMFGKALQDGDRRAPRLRRILFSLAEMSEGLNAEYIASRTNEYVREMQLKQAIYAASDRWQQGGESRITDLESIFNEALRARQDTMDAGLFMNDPERSLNFLTKSSSSLYPLGIPELDRHGIGPTAKEMLLYIAAKNTGKTWFCVHCGKQGLIHGQRVLHITLEVREEETAARYHQSLWSGARRGGRYDLTVFEFDQLGRLSGLKLNKQKKPRMDFSHPDAAKDLRAKMKPWGIRLGRIVIKEFPTASLTMSQLINYIDYLELVHKFIPTVLIVDYPDLMDVKTSEFRLGLRRIYEQLRGLGVQRNMAVIAPTQGNRQSLDAKTVSASMIAEDKSKLDTADTVLIYSQTQAEYRLGLARLYLQYARTAPRDIMTLITQSYHTGQFALQSALMQSVYWDRVKELSGAEPGGEE